jgi:hypothetical protein
MRTTRRWSDLDRRQRRWVAAAAAVQLSLAAAAWRDLARRPAAQVNGPKGLWAAVISVNFVGPVAYFLRGRRRSGAVGAEE